MAYLDLPEAFRKALSSSSLDRERPYLHQFLNLSTGVHAATGDPGHFSNIFKAQISVENLDALVAALKSSKLDEVRAAVRILYPPDSIYVISATDANRNITVKTYYTRVICAENKWQAAGNSGKIPDNILKYLINRPQITKIPVAVPTNAHYPIPLPAALPLPVCYAYKPNPIAASTASSDADDYSDPRASSSGEGHTGDAKPSVFLSGSTGATAKSSDGVSSEIDYDMRVLEADLDELLAVDKKGTDVGWSDASKAGDLDAEHAPLSADVDDDEMVVDVGLSSDLSPEDFDAEIHALLAELGGDEMGSDVELTDASKAGDLDADADADADADKDDSEASEVSEVSEASDESDEYVPQAKVKAEANDMADVAKRLQTYKSLPFGDLRDKNLRARLSRLHQFALHDKPFWDVAEGDRLFSVATAKQLGFALGTGKPEHKHKAMLEDIRRGILQYTESIECLEMLQQALSKARSALYGKPDVGDKREQRNRKDDIKNCEKLVVQVRERIDEFNAVRVQLEDIEKFLSPQKYTQDFASLADKSIMLHSEQDIASVLARWNRDVDPYQVAEDGATLAMPTPDATTAKRIDDHFSHRCKQKPNAECILYGVKSPHNTTLAFSENKQGDFKTQTPTRMLDMQEQALLAQKMAGEYVNRFLAANPDCDPKVLKIYLSANPNVAKSVELAQAVGREIFKLLQPKLSSLAKIKFNRLVSVKGLSKPSTWGLERGDEASYKAYRDKVHPTIDAPEPPAASSALFVTKAP